MKKMTDMMAIVMTGFVVGGAVSIRLD